MAQGRVAVGHPVDVGSGAVFTASVDFTIPGSLEMNWRRHYSTATSRNTWLGVKWTVPYFTRLERHSDRYVLMDVHGGEITFVSASPLRAGDCLVNLGSNMEIRREEDRFIVIHWHNGGSVSRSCFIADDQPTAVLAWIENLAGHKVRIEYDSAGRPAILFQELERRTVELIYDAGDLVSLVQFVGKNGRKLLVKYEYDDRRRLIASVDAMGYRKGYEYDPQNRLVAETNPLGSRFIFEYDRLGRCTRTAGDDGFQQRRLKYLSAPPMTRVTDGLGAITEYHLNQAGQVVQIVTPTGSVTTRKFDEHGRLVGVDHPDGSRETRSYDDKGDLAKSVDPCGAATITEHNALHAPVKLTDRNGNAWQLPNKYEGSLAGVEKLPRGPWNYTWDSRRLVRTAQRQGGLSIEVRRDESLRWQEIRDNISLVQRTEYDEFGYPTRVFDAEGLLSETKYDGLHRVAEIRHADSAFVRFERNAIGRRTKRTGPARQRDAWQYDKYGYPVTQTNSLGHIIHFEHDKEGNLIGVVNRVGERIEYRRDSEGRIIEEKLFDGRIQHYEYDVMGRQVSIGLSDGRTVAQKFDAAGRLLSRKSSDGLAEEFAYDKEGRVIKASNGAAVVDLKRDRYGRILEEIQNGRPVRYRYNAAGNRIFRSIPFDTGGSKLTREFDERGRLIALQDERGTCQEFQWDGLDRLIARRCSGDLLETFNYDERRHMVEQRVETRNTRLKFITKYDERGNLSARHDSRKGTFEFDYDLVNRLTNVRSNFSDAESYEYDANQAITRTHHGVRRVASGGRALHDGSREISYGEDGAVASIRVDSKVTSLKHDVNGRLREVINVNGQLISYEYDPFGRRTAKVIDGERTEFLWEGWSLAAEVHSGAAHAIYFCADIKPLAQWRNGERFTLVLDSRSAVHDIFDGYGQRRGGYVSDAYGNIVSRDGDVSSPFRLRGQYYDTETQLHYNFYRHYDPQVGDYTAPDPIGIKGGHNFFAYPRNPLRWDDPFGLSCKPGHDGPPEDEEEPPQTAGKGPVALADTPEEPTPGEPSHDPSAFPNLNRGGGNTDEHADRVVDAITNSNPPMKQNRSVTVIEHEDGSVSVGLSGGDPKRAANAQQAVDDLNQRYPSDPPTYRTTGPVDATGLNDPGSPANPSPLPGTCSEPHAAQAAGANPSNPQSYQTVWTGPADCPPDHQLPGQPTTAGGNEQMQPCKTCQSNAGNYTSTSTQSSQAPSSEPPPTSGGPT